MWNATGYNCENGSRCRDVVMYGRSEVVTYSGQYNRLRCFPRSDLSCLGWGYFFLEYFNGHAIATVLHFNVLITANGPASTDPPFRIFSRSDVGPDVSFLILSKGDKRFKQRGNFRND